MDLLLHTHTYVHMIPPTNQLKTTTIEGRVQDLSKILKTAELDCHPKMIIDNDNSESSKDDSALKSTVIKDISRHFFVFCCSYSIFYKIQVHATFCN
ncbi:unnamed protein product [Ceratitis capitata]|uniref:(Mediterranean fruit fly) hypothetical protein n=1 Tax=Ceratitis capitata TaxID=7213 RepID=A0A811U7M0_CERCA|nr:unnamed protein product [Ceratitis capitata]